MAANRLLSWTALSVIVLCGCSIHVSAGKLPGILAEFSAVFRPEQKCERLTAPICSRYTYNHTTMPNFLNHQSQEEAASVLKGYCQLINTQCSAELPFLLCSYHFPICVNGLMYPVVPCKSLCKRVKRACRPILERANFSWPKSLDCSQLPGKSSRDGETPLIMCMNSAPEDTQPEQEFCPVRAPQCPPSPSCALSKARKRIFCNNYFGWAVQGTIVAETASQGYHAYVVRVKTLLHSENAELLRDGMFERDATGGYNITVHTGQRKQCDKCPKLEVGAKELIVAGELSTSAPHLLFRPPVAIATPSKASLLTKVPKQMGKCNSKHRALLAAAGA